MGDQSIDIISFFCFPSGQNTYIYFLSVLSRTEFSYICFLSILSRTEFSGICAQYNNIVKIEPVICYEKILKFEKFQRSKEGFIKIVRIKGSCHIYRVFSQLKNQKDLLGSNQCIFKFVDF